MNDNFNCDTSFKFWHKQSMQERIISGIARACVSAGVHPNLITITGFALGLVAVYIVNFIGGKWSAVAVVLYYLNRVLDGVDGCVARKSGKTSSFGNMLDKFCDVTVTLLMYAAALYSCNANWHFLLILIFVFRVARAAQPSVKIEYVSILANDELWWTAEFICVNFMCQAFSALSCRMG